MEHQVTHYPEKKRFETVVEGQTAYVEYELFDKGVDLIHTIVPKPLEGRGIAAVLVKTAFEYAQASALQVKTTCPYTTLWLKRHPEYADLHSIENINSKHG